VPNLGGKLVIKTGRTSNALDPKNMTPTITQTNYIETTDKNQTIKIAKQSEYSVDMYSRS